MEDVIQGGMIKEAAMWYQRELGKKDDEEFYI
jgi:hypothetical protein